MLKLKFALTTLSFALAFGLAASQEVTQPPEIIQKISPELAYADVILNPNIKEGIQSIAARIAHRETVEETWKMRGHFRPGTTALFTGPSGTGKTFSAEAMANDLGVELLYLDLSLLATGYIGETEKNLARLFDGATATGAVLFFDEADALFGKRTQVQSSNDRFANLEVSYLLQRIETHPGLVIMSTNRSVDIDSAFRRRFDFIIDFVFPDANQRLQIWRRAFSSETPLSADVDFEVLAERFELTHADIHAIALYAAYNAADLGSDVTMAMITQAVRRRTRLSER